MAQKGKEEEWLNLKEKIFDAGMEIMKEKDFESMTIREICARVQISTGMFYKLYATKLDLLTYYYEKAQNEYDLDMKQNLKELPIEEQLVQFYNWVLRFTSSLGTDFCRHFFDSKNAFMNGEVFHNKIVAMTDELMEDAQGKGFVIPPGRTIHEISKELCVITKGIIFDWSATQGAYDMTQYGERLLRRILPALLE